MLRILCCISIYGNKLSLRELVSKNAIPNGELNQIGLKRKIQDVDSWCYSSPTYQFTREKFDIEVRDFLIHHLKIGEILKTSREGIQYALFTICPVEQSFEDEFSCLLTRETLDILSNLRLALEVAPAVIMPEVEYWAMQTD